MDQSKGLIMYEPQTPETMKLGEIATILDYVKSNDITVEKALKEIKAIANREDVKVLNFKEWLAKEGIETKLFWSNCKKKNQGFPHIESRVSRKVVSANPKHWLALAFDWSTTYWYTEATWKNLNSKWRTEVKQHKGLIAHGFTDKVIGNEVHTTS